MMRRDGAEQGGVELGRERSRAEQRESIAEQRERWPGQKGFTKISEKGHKLKFPPT